MKQLLLSDILHKVNDFVQENANLAEEIDFIVGVSRGGLIPAAWLAAMINKPLVTAYIDKKDNVYFDRFEWIKGKKVLLVDDICRSGKTLVKLLNLIQINGEPASLNAYTLYSVPSLRLSEFKEFIDLKLKTEEIENDVNMPWDFDRIR